MPVAEPGMREHVLGGCAFLGFDGEHWSEEVGELFCGAVVQLVLLDKYVFEAPSFEVFDVAKLSLAIVESGLALAAFN